AAIEHTSIKLTGTYRPRLLSEFFVSLPDLKCNVVGTEVWTHNMMVSSVLYVTDEATSAPKNDPHRILRIKYLFCNVLKGNNDVRIFNFLEQSSHGGSDGLHGYVPSLDHVFVDMVSSHPDVESMLEGAILTSIELRVRPTHPIFGFSGANKRGIPVSRDPTTLVAKIHHVVYKKRKGVLNSVQDEKNVDSLEKLAGSFDWLVEGKDMALSANAASAVFRSFQRHDGSKVARSIPATNSFTCRQGVRVKCTAEPEKEVSAEAPKTMTPAAISSK
ncbi:hypothetical protein KI387_014671, partial [Taxus chinensis]